MEKEHNWKPLAGRNLKDAIISEDPPFRAWSIPINWKAVAAHARADAPIPHRPTQLPYKPPQETLVLVKPSEDHLEA